jgi:hypothetical protein
MNKAYQIEIVIAAVGILVVAMFLLPRDMPMTGHISGVNITMYTQSLDITADGSQYYTLASLDDKNLPLKSFLLSGEVIGAGRVEILLDNGEQQLLVYENKIKKQEASTYGITGAALTEGDEDITQEGVWLAIVPSKAIDYEFLPLGEDEKLVSGAFGKRCIETCNMPEGLFNDASYNLIFRLEKGTVVKLYSIDYTLQEE